MELLCPWETAQYFIFSSNVPALLYYSHLVAVVAAVVFALLLIPRVRESLPVKLFLTTILFFTIWTVVDLPLWALNRPDISLFLWSLQVLAEMFIYVAAFYFAYAFIAQKDLRFVWKVGLTLLLAPIIVLLPTPYLFPGVDISWCVVSETPFVIFYTYSVEILLSFLILFISFWGLHAQPVRRKEIILFTTGLIVFLIALSSGNIVGSITENWDLAQAGLFGMPVFIAFLTYTVVKFKTFNVKLFATQALVAGITVLIGARLFYSTTTTGIILSAVTLGAFLVSGVFLVRSVKKEIEQREHIEMLAKELEETNKRQEGLLHFIGHEVKGFLTKDEGAFAALVDGDFGALQDGMKPFVESALAQTRNGVRSVTDILTASNQKKGTLSYAKESFDLKALITDIVDKAQPMAKAKGLLLAFSADAAGAPYMVSGDKAKIGDNVIRNVIENSIHYTPTGSITASLKKENGKFIFSVRDTGVGISAEDRAKLFTEGGHGKDSQKINAHSTGYGLYIAKNITEAHGGTIRAESEGEGKGSTFTVELPV